MKKQKIVINAISDYLYGIKNEASINLKAHLFTVPDSNTQIKTYLLIGDKIKIIQHSSDNKWVDIGCITSKGTPLVAWFKVGAVVK